MSDFDPDYWGHLIRRSARQSPNKMTDDKLRERIKIWRIAACEVGSMHGYWDVIFDAEAILKGEQSIMNRAQVEKALAEEPDLSAHYAASKRGATRS